MENVKVKQINDYLVRNNLLSNKQSGFMKARSCTFALANAVDDHMLKLDDNYIAFLVLLAFDSVDHKVLLRKLQTLVHSISCNL